MAFEAVDACFGTPHISSDDLAALNTATVGKADCVLHYGDDFKAVMSSANECLIGTGVGMVGGRRFWNQAATSLTIQSGTQGQKRNDLVVARYAKTSAGIESITPVVVKGTPSTGTAADPATTSNDLKLWRIPLDGISVGTPVRLFDPVASLATLGDSVSPTVLYSDASWLIVSSGMFCTVIAKSVKVTGSGWTLKDCPYVLPLDKRPKKELQAPAYAYPNANARLIIDGNTGKIRVGSGDNSNINSDVSAFIVWIAGI